MFPFACDLSGRVLRARQLRLHAYYRALTPSLYPHRTAKKAGAAEKGEDQRGRARGAPPEPGPAPLRLVAPATTPFGTLSETYDEVDRLLAERPGKKGLEYLVRWRGWLACGDTWEPEAHLPE